MKDASWTPMLSEHMCEGWLEGYLLTGRHGFFASYESFIRVVDSMVSQHAKWLKVCNQPAMATDDRFSQPDSDLQRMAAGPQRLYPSGPGYARPCGEQKSGCRPHVSAAGRELPAVAASTTVFRARNYVNVIVASKHPSMQWLTMDQAVVHCTQGVGIWDWASTDQEAEPDLVMACCGDTPTVEALAATYRSCKDHMPELKIRFVNVVDLMKLQSEHATPARTDRRGV